jgi:hypothetical protein
MANDSLKKVVAKAQREVAGADASSRFDYQKSWAFCEMIRRHIAGQPYLVAFEFHDDVVFFDSASAPRSAEFYQVKTREGVKLRTSAELLQRKASKNSILGKMCLNFSGIAATMNVSVGLVSNVAFKFAPTDAAFTTIPPDEQTAIKTKLKAELPSFASSNLKQMRFLVFPVAIGDIQTHVHGRAVDLVAHKYGPTITFNVLGWLLGVQAEIKRKNSIKPDKITTVAELLSEKCLDNIFIDYTLTRAVEAHEPPVSISLVAQDLKAAGWETVDVVRVEKGLVQAFADYRNPKDLECQRMADAIGKQLDAAPDAAIAPAIAAARLALSAQGFSTRPYSDPFYQAALTVIVWHERL